MNNYIKSTVLFTVIFVLASCSNKVTVPSSPQITYVGPPDSLLTIPCKATPAGESLIDLALAQNKNVGCIGMLHKQMKKIRDNKKQQESLYAK